MWGGFRQFALTRGHENLAGGESRRRDWLRRVPSPLEGRFTFLVAAHWLSFASAFAGWYAPQPALRAFAARQDTKSRLRGSRKRLFEATRKPLGTLPHLCLGACHSATMPTEANYPFSCLFVRREGGVRVRRERRRRQSRCDVSHVVRRSLRPPCDTAHQGCAATRLDVVGFRGRA